METAIIIFLSIVFAFVAIDVIKIILGLALMILGGTVALIAAGFHWIVDKLKFS